MGKARVGIKVWWALGFAFVLSISANATTPPSEICSSDQKYCVRMVPTPGQPDECTLKIISGDKTLAEFPTFGYLLDVFFSPDQHYVAINNRRANAGDYLWVISLPDGKELKMPDDVADELGKKDVGKIRGDHAAKESIPSVLRLCPDCRASKVRHGFLFADGWSGTSTLKVVEELEFGNGWIALTKICRITAHGLILANQTAEKEERASERVRQAWTWSPFHSD